MQFNQNLLIQNDNVVDIMESIMDCQFNFVYLDLPWFTGRNEFSYSLKEENRQSNLELKKYLASQRGCKIHDINIADIKEETLKRRLEIENKEKDEYGVYISKILENSMRILHDTGILVFRSPAESAIDYKLMLDQVFSNTYIMQVTLEMENRRWANNNPLYMNHEILYFYSKSDKYNLNQIYEDFSNYSEEFVNCDKRDRYKLISLITNTGCHSYAWKGITPTGNQKWRYRKEEMDELFEDDRIVIKGERSFLKYYMKEHPREKSTVWKAYWGSFFDVVEKPSGTMRGKHFIDLLKMVTDNNDWIFAPYDFDQKLPVIAQNLNRKWVTVNPICGQGYNYKEFLAKGSFEEVTSIQGNTEKIVYKNVLKNIDDINNLKGRLTKLNIDISVIKNQLGLVGEDEEIVIEQIQEKIDELIEKSDIEHYIPIVKEWIRPFWGRLEAESKRFLPTAELLYQEYKETDQFDLSTAMLAYCKALEKEIYTKMFKGYIKKLIEDGINIKNTFPEDFISNETKRFAESIKLFTTRYKNNDSKWHFELGTMVYILKIVLDSDESPFLSDGRIYRDFKKYLEQQFEYSFFDIGFMTDLDNVAKLRNDSAHPQIVTSDRINQGKELTKKKIVDLLKCYK